ncbi:MAG TPA: NUDIX domain-containing protein [Gemmatimonadota bacterium]|nr:NUDIX domain-containing protein [Gemmatimonadota bacterium]
MSGDSAIVSDLPVEEIVLAAIVDVRGRVLVQPRAGDPALAGTWELPGGKVRPGEDHAAALAREVEEETGVAVRVGELAVALCHMYPDRRVAIHAYLCDSVGGARPVRWARWTSPEEYRAMPMPEANAAIVDALERAVHRPSRKPLTNNSSISYK